MQTILPYGTAVLAVAFYAFLTPLAKKMQLDFPPFTFVALTASLLAVMASLCAFVFEKGFVFHAVKGSAWGGLVLFTTINLAAFVLYLGAIKKIPASEYQMIYLLSPFFVAVLAFFLLGETFKLQYALGLLIVGGGLFLALF